MANTVKYCMQLTKYHAVIYFNRIVWISNLLAWIYDLVCDSVTLREDQWPWVCDRITDLGNCLLDSCSVCAVVSSCPCTDGSDIWCLPFHKWISLQGHLRCFLTYPWMLWGFLLKPARLQLSWHLAGILSCYKMSHKLQQQLSSRSPTIRPLPASSYKMSDHEVPT